MKPPKPCRSANFRNRSIQTPKKTSAGATQDRIVPISVFCGTPVISTPERSIRARIAGFTIVVINCRLPPIGSLNVPVIASDPTATEAILPSFR